MPEKEYLILLDFDTRKRHYHVSKAGKIIKFVVQIEVNTEGKWREILRYDCAHNFTHRDSYNLKRTRIGQCEERTTTLSGVGQARQT